MESHTPPPSAPGTTASGARPRPEATPKRRRRWLRWLAALALTPVALFLLLAVAVYLPPVQRLLVDEVCRRIGRETGLDVRIGRVRLAFPLDLALGDFSAREGRDTLVAARALRLEVALWPLLEGRADIEGFGLYDTRLHTKDWISDTRLEGRVGQLTARSHGVEWARERIRLDELRLERADLLVALTDTAPPDTSASTSRWDIRLGRASVRDTRLRLILPGDSMYVRARLGRATLADGHFDTGAGRYTLGRLALEGSALGLDLGPRASASPEEADSFGPGLNPSHLRLSGLALEARGIGYGPADTLRLDLRGLRFSERSGLAVRNLSGRVYMDSTRLSVPAFRLRTRHSRADIGAEIPWREALAGRMAGLGLTLDAALGHEDVTALLGALADPALTALYPRETLTLRARVRGGEADRLDLERLEAALGQTLRLTASGQGRGLSGKHPSGRLRLDATLSRPAAFSALLPAGTALPRRLRLGGTAGLDGRRLTADLALEAGGRARLKGRADLESETYALELDARRFPLGAFLPGQGLGPLTARLSARGRGFDPTSRRARLAARGRVDAFSFGQWPLGGLALDATLGGGHLEAGFSADNPLARARGRLEARIDGPYEARLDADAEEIAVWRLAGMADTLSAGGQLRLTARADRKFRHYGLEGGLENLRFLTPRRSISARDVTLSFAAAPDSTSARLSSGDLSLSLDAGEAPGGIGTALGRTAALLTRQIEARELDHEALRQALPRMTLRARAGTRNPLYALTRHAGMTFRSLRLDLDAAPGQGLSGRLDAGAFHTGTLLVDTLEARLTQEADGLRLHAEIRNQSRGNPHKFRAETDAYLLANTAGAGLRFYDADGRKGMDFGLRATLADSTLQASIEPENPVIAYRDFHVNPDNYLRLDRRGIAADIDLLADDGTGLSLYGEPTDSLSDLTLSLSRVNLGELSATLPFLPQLAGLLSGDIHVTQDARRNLSAGLFMQARDLAVEGAPIGDLGLEGIYLPEDSGRHVVSAYILRDTAEVLSLEGAYFQHTGAFTGRATLDGFPLDMANGFLASADVALTGTASGQLDLSGTTDRPVIDGSLRFDDGHIRSAVYGFDFRMDDKPVEVRRSVLTLDGFALRSAGNEPLVVSGGIDLADPARIGLGLQMHARSYELIHAEKSRESLVYGRLLADFDGSVRGTTDHIVVRGKLDVLGGTDLTYILKDSPLTVDDRLSQLVRFVDFSDTTAVAPPPAAAGTFDMTLAVGVSDAARFHCLLSEDGQSYVDIEGGGNLTLRMTETGDMRLTGRLTMNAGEMKYELPVIPLKTFALKSGSYIEFTGDAANPTLDIAATERVKASVTENDLPRSVNFDVGLHITQTLSNMGLTFTIDAPEDLSVQNQLRAMTDAGRAKAAVAMLATGMYLTDEALATGSGGFKATNALNAFLQSEIQNIAGSALRTVDISLGVEDNTTAAGTTTTDYSFRFAKRFWNDRVALVVGGKVSTGSQAENSAATFIDNISVEYRLDRGSTRYVRAFYDRSATDPLEGQYTRTGAGLVLRRKTERLGELFLFRKPKAQPAPGAR